MLIPSDRHRPGDLRLWAELEAADIVHGSRPALSAKIDRSLDAIAGFADAGACYGSISWGKDSVTLAHLIARSGRAVPLVHLRAIPTANPLNSLVADDLAARFTLTCHELEVDYSSIDPGLSPDEAEARKDFLFYRTFREAGARFGARHLSGIRADESSGRKARMRRWGLASPNACAPLGWWTAADVFGYLAIHELPVHPNYAMLGGGRWDRRHLRVDELGGDRGAGFGRATWEREYYGDFLRRLARG